MRLLHLLWPHLPLRLAASRATADPRSGSFPTGPLVLGGQPWTAGTVLDASREAQALGVRRGMPLGTAHRLCPEATFVDPAPDADREAVEAAFERLAAFSPGLAGTSDVTDPAFGRIEVQVDGLGPLWGPDDVLVARLADAVRNLLPGMPRAGIAGTRFAATVAAAHADPSVATIPLVVPIRGEADFLAPLPSALLTPDLEIRARLRRFGLRQIGAVAALPRTALVARFGTEGGRVHARAVGEETDSFRPRRAPERLRLALPIDPPVGDLEPLRFVLHRVAVALGEQLVGRGAATGRAELRLTLDRAFARPDVPERVAFEQRFPEPTAEGEAIERLFLVRLERTPPPAPVERLELELFDVAPAAGQQLALFAPRAAGGVPTVIRRARLDWQLARLALAFGEDRVRRASIADPEAPLAERRATWATVGSGSRVLDGR
ncbi:MAG TPA: DNA polymerase Y family protein [Candidatus Limnocylindrales bacterium]